jgi:hypothetical protein
VGDAISNGVVDVTVGYALGRVLDRLRGWRKEREEQGAPGGFEVSRGAAAMLAGGHVGEEFGEKGPLEIEAVEEPSNIAGYEPTEISYVGVEPWIVLLRNREAKVRYVAVVLPDGTVAGALRIPFLPFEEGFLGPTRFGGGEGD